MLNREGVLNYDDYVAHYCGNDVIKSYRSSVLSDQEDIELKQGHKKGYETLGKIGNLFRLRNQFDKKKRDKNFENDTNSEIEKSELFSDMKLLAKNIKGNDNQVP